MKRTVYEVIRRPLITEKGNLLRDEQNQFLFEVAFDVNKIEIRHAIEKAFGVRVLDVRTSIQRGKVKRVGRNVGRRPNWKRAIVTLHEDDHIELFEGV